MQNKPKYAEERLPKMHKNSFEMSDGTFAKTSILNHEFGALRAESYLESGSVCGVFCTKKSSISQRYLSVLLCDEVGKTCTCNKGSFWGHNVWNIVRACE